ncbi:hypothetical protein TH9_12305 [Thalassospira xiamenensis]|uniref:hypothetical protein n=1 Tax=Thalassospira xiamenensis TaxID=220697 RepID=UPI000DEDE775|nr:hypothetical protein [Thalassospira xiamenensis]RCK32504.1 hypothetical protein TH9_12305 [Thalassospira xiamenensis]
MANREIPDEFIKRVRAAVLTKSVDGKIGKAVAVLRIAKDPAAKYEASSGLVRIDGRPHEIKIAVNQANAILKECGLLDMRIAYPGSDYIPAFLNRHRPANDQGIEAFLQGGA